MKHRLLLFAVVLLLSIAGQAQTKTTKVDLTWGEEQSTSRRVVMDDIIGSDEEGIYIIKRTPRGETPILIESYGNDMLLKKSVAVPLGEKRESRVYQYATQIDGELILFSTLLDNRSKVNMLFAQTIHKKTLNLSSKLTKIGAIEYDGRSKRNSGSFTYTISNDEKRILIYYNLPQERDENEKFSYHILDKDLNLLWEKKITLPYENELFSVVDYDIQENGDLYLLSKIFKDKAKAIRKGKPNYQYQIIAYTDQGENKIEYPVNLEDKFLIDMKIAIHLDGDIICGGFYSDNGTTTISGSYFLKIDESTKSIVSKSFKEFELDFITQNMTDKDKRRTQKRKAKGKEVDLFQYGLEDIVLKEDGGAILIGEQYFVRVVTTTDGQGNVSTSYHYFYNDILVLNINADGEIEWAEKIAKRQHTVNDGGYFSSYALAITGDKINFIFNDNAKNLASSKMTRGKAKGVVYEFTKNNRTSVAVLVQIDGDGRQVKEALFNAKDSKLLIRPKVAEQVSDYDMVIYGQKRKTERFGKITFKP
jgi:hypothetical protein